MFALYVDTWSLFWGHSTWTVKLIVVVLLLSGLALGFFRSMHMPYMLFTLLTVVVMVDVCFIVGGALVPERASSLPFWVTVNVFLSVLIGLATSFTSGLRYGDA